MIRFAADEDFNNDVLRALRRGAVEMRNLLTHDVTTMTRHARDRVARGEVMPRVIAVHQRLLIGEVLNDLGLVATCSVPSDWVDRVHFLPLRWRSIRQPN